MFSSVIFHDHARQRGVKPILGCEVYVAPGQPARPRAATPARRRTTWCCWPRRIEGYHNLIKLVSAGYTEGFYYKPRIDKELLAQHAKGLIGLSSCLKGEVAEGLSHQQERKALEAAGGVSRHPRARATSSSRCSGTASRSSGSSTAGCRRSRAISDLPLVCTNDVHYLRETDAHPHDILLCIGTGKAFSDPKRLRYDAQAVLPEDRRGDGGGRSRTFPTRCANTVRIAERCNVDARRRARTTCRTSTCRAGFTLDDYFEHVVREGFAQRLPRLQQLAAAGALRHTIDEYERRLVVRDRDDQADEVSRVLPDRLGLHPLRARAGHSGRARAAARRPAAWSPTACGSPTSIRSTSISSSSASSTPSACRCPISTSTSASGAAARSSSTSRGSTAARTSRRSSRSAR